MCYVCLFLVVKQRSGPLNMPLPSKQSMQEPKTAYELLSDPHFLFTMISLLASVSVFFYYLFQLLFRTQDWRTEKVYTPPASRKSSGNQLSASTAAAGGGGNGNGKASGAPSRRSAELASIEQELDNIKQRTEKRRQLLEAALSSSSQEGATKVSSQPSSPTKAEESEQSSSASADEPRVKPIEASTAQKGEPSGLRKRIARRED